MYIIFIKKKKEKVTQYAKSNLTMYPQYLPQILKTVLEASLPQLLKLLLLSLPVKPPAFF